MCVDRDIEGKLEKGTLSSVTGDEYFKNSVLIKVFLKLPEEGLHNISLSQHLLNLCLEDLFNI